MWERCIQPTLAPPFGYRTSLVKPFQCSSSPDSAARAAKTSTQGASRNCPFSQMRIRPARSEMNSRPSGENSMSQDTSSPSAMTVVANTLPAGGSACAVKGSRHKLIRGTIRFNMAESIDDGDSCGTVTQRDRNSLCLVSGALPGVYSGANPSTPKFPVLTGKYGKIS